MSAFSRGCLSPRQFLHSSRTTSSFLFSSSFPRARLLTSTSFRYATKKSTSITRQIDKLKASVPRTKPSAPNASPAEHQRATQAYLNLHDTLALKSHPTLLYHAPSHTGYMTASYIGTTFCFAYVLTQIGHYFDPREGISWYVPYLIGTGCIFMAGMGGVFMLGPAGIIKTLTAMPLASLEAVGASTKGLNSSSMRIEVEFRKMFPIPFMPARKIYVEAKEIRLAHQLAAPKGRRSIEEIRATKALVEEERQKALEYERTHILSKGPRAVSRGLFELLRGTRRMLTREGFTSIWVKDRKYKLDVSGGWALNEGKALDRLITIKPDV